MKRRASISNKTLQLTLGFLLGMFVLVQTAPDSTYMPNQDTQEQSEDAEGGQQQLKLSEAVPSSSIQINLDFQSILLSEVDFDDDKSDQNFVNELAIFSSGKALKVLFRRIISPNAP